jgi:hypothetical protein
MNSRQTRRIAQRAGIGACALLLAACSGGAALAPPGSSGISVPAVRAGQALPFVVNPARRERRAGKIELTPTSLSILGLGKAMAQKVAVSEPGYRGAFTEKSTCAKFAAVTPKKGKGPKFTVTVSGTAPGTCAIRFADTRGNRAMLPVSVTSSTIVIGQRHAP